LDSVTALTNGAGALVQTYMGPIRVQ